MRAKAPADDVARFVKIAAAKALRLSFDPVADRNQDVALECLDTDLLRASIENALERASARNLDALVARLDALLRDGTLVQQVDFVLGSRPTYYFPDDVQKMVLSGPSAAHPFEFQEFCWMRCRPLADGTHHCEEYQNRICLIGEAT